MQAERPDTTGEPQAPPPIELPEFLAVNREGLAGKVFDLRRKLYRKAKREPAFRFYTLYEAVCRTDVLRAAWDRVAANDGAPGVDGLSIKQVAESPHGVLGFLAELQAALKSKTYRPQHRHLRRRSQRPFRPPAGVSWTDQLYRLGLVPLAVPRPAASR